MKLHRIEFEGALYHVTQRGNNREKIFRCDTDKLHFLEELEKCKLIFNFGLYGYMLMDNHYLIQTLVGPIHKIMHRVNFLHSRYFNRRYNRTDHLYGDRYGAALIRMSGIIDNSLFDPLSSSCSGYFVSGRSFHCNWV